MFVLRCLRISSHGCNFYFHFISIIHPAFQGAPIHHTALRGRSELIAASSELLSFFDLAGHERYFKTTVRGLSGTRPDYVMMGTKMSFACRSSLS